jgi:uncharacterized membrane protein SpoIIM required for sporulation
MYRQLCQTQALARQRGYSPLLTAQLDARVRAMHRRFYAGQSGQGLALRRLLLTDFPRCVREEWRVLLVVCLVFLLSAVTVGLLIALDPTRAYHFAAPEDLARFREMYDPARARFGRGGADADVMMFGHYIWNNVSIGFRTFAVGLFGGVPALVVVLMNGIHLGVVAGWLSTDAGTARMLWSFVITHASLEITGLLLMAVAGVRLGLTLLRPGRDTRRVALATAATRRFPMIAGASIMIFLAAFIEAFWSANAWVPDWGKLGVGAVAWVAVIVFFWRAGRSDAA